MCHLLFFAILLAVTCSDESTPSASAEDHRAADAVILEAYRSAADGFSTDEVIIQDALRSRWLAAVDPQWQQRSDDWQTQTLLRLLSLRKAGKLRAQTMKHGAPVDESLQPIAEIAARLVLEQHAVSTDQLLCDPRLRQELQRNAETIQPDVDADSIRKAVLRLRKTRRLRPELTLRVTDWDRTVETWSLVDLVEAIKKDSLISQGPGVYLFRDATGYLYIGEAANLKARLLQHLEGSDRVSLKAYLGSVASGTVTVELHRFGDASPAKSLVVRRAYESELIRSRTPRLNVRP